MKTFIGCVEEYKGYVGSGNLKQRLFKAESLEEVCLTIIREGYGTHEEDLWKDEPELMKKEKENPFETLIDKNGDGADYWIISELVDDKLISVFPD